MNKALSFDEWLESKGLQRPTPVWYDGGDTEFRLFSKDSLLGVFKTKSEAAVEAGLLGMNPVDYIIGEFIIPIDEARKKSRLEEYNSIMTEYEEEYDVYCANYLDVYLDQWQSIKTYIGDNDYTYSMSDVEILIFIKNVLKLLGK